ncbi:MAG: hypothetical protein GX621_10095, partial [Pirellulaceae bacterium]|nr:hypothetical protein [Pirellulaceae bacterium]
QYEFNGATYTSDRYDFFVAASSSGYEGKKRVVDQYKNAANPVCYVDPDEPAEAVLQRDLTIKNAIGLFPLIFVVAGAAVLIFGLKQKDRPGKAWLPRMKTAQVAPTESRFGFEQDAFDATPDAVTLRPNMSPLGKLGLVAFACLFWNGIVSVFVYQVVEGFRTGNPEWFLTIFMIPFVLVGLGFVVAVFYVALTLFNPRYTMTLRPGLIQPGTTGSIAWKASGSAGRIQQLSIKLVGQEKASYTVGTDTRTEEKTFFESDLVDTRDLWQLAAGEVEFAVPADAMHSFESAHNKIVWSIKLHGHIALWPDVSDEYKIAVLPARLD